MGWVTLVLRRYHSPVIKTIIIIFAATFLWLQIRIASFPDETPFVVEVPPSNLSWVVQNESQAALLAILKYVTQVNDAQVVHNLDQFGPLLPGDAVIVVQIHNRWHYLLSLIDSLQKSPGINHTLLILSHDMYSPFLESIPPKVTFCKVMQIFFPYSVQLFPRQFPGQDPNDCPRDMNKKDAMLKGCTNAMHPDSFGHYREAKFSQTKHHWWWKMNRIMDGLNITKNHPGPFILLEEDHYVSPDFLHVLRLMEKLRENQCKKCSLLVLGTYVKAFNYHLMGSQVETIKWASSRHNMGMVMYRDLWVPIKNCSPTFCTFDDYNWDWSLYRTSTVCLPNAIFAMVVKATRVFHIGECGVHHKGKDCNSQKMVHQAKHVLNSAHAYLYPANMIIRQSIPRAMKPPKGNGGWGDIRDHQLCLSYINRTVPR